VRTAISFAAESLHERSQAMFGGADSPLFEAILFICNTGCLFLN